MPDTLEAAVGMTRKWDAREAGREVAENTIRKLSRPPDFFLVFTTIHYEKNGGFQQFLNGIWDVLPPETPLVGGTVVGFINPEGCYTRGASALAVSSVQMDVVIGMGKGTKRNPKKAARTCATQICKGLEKSNNKNKFLLTLVAGPGFIKIPGYGYKKVIDSGITSKFVISAIKLSRLLLQRGSSREDEVFGEIAKKLPDFNIILGTTLDDIRGISNYQFYGKKVYSNAVVCLGFSTNLDMNLCTSHGMKETEKKFIITKLKNHQIIQEINSEPALEEFYRIMNWPAGFINEKTMEHTILYYPISLKRENREVTVVMPFILKNSIMTPCLIDAGEARVLTISGKDLINSLNQCINFNEFEPGFGLFSNCMTILQTLGEKVNLIQEETTKKFGGKPYLMIWSAGEGTFKPNSMINYANMSFNSAVIGVKK
jgi:hypothetical protein